MAVAGRRVSTRCLRTLFVMRAGIANIRARARELGDFSPDRLFRAKYILTIHFTEPNKKFTPRRQTAPDLSDSRDAKKKKIEFNYAVRTIKCFVVFPSAASTVNKYLYKNRITQIEIFFLTLVAKRKVNTLMLSSALILLVDDNNILITSWQRCNDYILSIIVKHSPSHFQKIKFKND